MDSLCHPCITTTHLSYSVLSLKLPPQPCAALLALSSFIYYWITRVFIKMLLITILVLSSWHKSSHFVPRCLEPGVQRWPTSKAKAHCGSGAVTAYRDGWWMLCHLCLSGGIFGTSGILKIWGLKLCFFPWLQFYKVLLFLVSWSRWFYRSGMILWMPRRRGPRNWLMISALGARSDFPLDQTWSGTWEMVDTVYPKVAFEIGHEDKLDLGIPKFSNRTKCRIWHPAEDELLLPPI